MAEINEELRNILLKRQHYIYRFENGTVKELVGHFQGAKEQIASRIAHLEQYGQGHTLAFRLDRLNAQLAEIDDILANANAGAINNLTHNLQEFGYVEKEFVEGLIGDRFGKIGIDITRIPFEHVDEMVKTPLGGALYSDRMTANYQKTMFQMRTDLTQSMIQGEDMGKAARRLTGTGRAFGGTIGARIVKQANVIARTEIMRVSNAVNRRIFEENQDIVKGVQFVATLDARTCIACAVQDGKIFYFAKNPPTANGTPPIHPYCRCVFAPITKSWKELGAKNPNLKKAPPSTRATFTGQIGRPLQYESWLRMMNKKDPEFVREILGPARYNIWDNGYLKFSEMARDNRVLNLRELEELMKKKGVKIKTPERPLGRPRGMDRPVLEWKSTATKEEAAEQLNDLAKVKYDGVRVNPEFPTSALSDAKIKNALDSFGKEMVRLENSLPGLRERMKLMDEIKSLEFRPGQYFMSGNGPAGGMHTNLLGRIQISADHSLSPTLYVGEGGNLLVADDLISIFRHEYGHHLWYEGLTPFDRMKWTKFFDDVPTSFWDNEVSTYASTNVKEAFAESFCAYTSPHYKSGRGLLPKRIEAWFDENLGNIQGLKRKGRFIEEPKVKGPRSLDL